NGKRARLVGAANIEAGKAISPLEVCLDGKRSANDAWDFFDIATADSMRVIDDLSARFEDVPIGPWGDATQSAVLFPIPSNRAHKPAGVLIAGLSTRLVFDDGYRNFLELVTSRIATVIANARAYEEEKRRAESLAELNRAKTQFFSNVSHEFRTPLTLLLGPLAEALARTDLDGGVREELVVTQRNGLRLLKLVNTLLEFSRLEAGRVDAMYEPVDLCGYTAELASTFRSAFDKAGVRLSVQCLALEEKVFVDRDMWEKIVLNLLSNAFKHTFEGEVAVVLCPSGTDAVLEVRDTGVGIPPEHLPHVFERFHRVVSTRSRTYEGTGIGLALVQDLVRLHGGRVAVESTEGVGTTFRVHVPLGTAHLPADRVGTRMRSSATHHASPYIEEALRWLPDAPAVTPRLPAVAPASSVAGHVLLVDDNADMRDYVAGLLRERGWSVETSTNGLEALDAVHVRKPDLVLTDVMMPGLDGVALLRELRADARTKDVPVIMVSARAGEEARIEGLDAGADDYLVKPFAAQELVARVQSHVRLARARADAAAQVRRAKQRLSTLVREAPVAVAVLRGPRHEFEIANEVYCDAVGRSEDTLIGKAIADAFPELDLRDHLEHLDRVYATGETFGVSEYLRPVVRPDGRRDEAYFSYVYQPLRDEDGKIDAIAVVSVEITPLVRARAAAEAANADKMNFLAAMSHELRTPLNAIAGYADLLQLGIHGEVNDEQRHVIARMQRSGQR
ncbi:MAG TPA: response regulator, partial [Gemmatimonadaceae bacterium]